MRELNVAQFVEADWGDLITGYALQVVGRAADEIVVAGKGFELVIYGHIREGGISVTYFDTTRSPQIGYFLTEYLVHKRPRALPPPEPKAELKLVEHLERKLAAAGEILRWAADDILRGERDWMETYHLPTKARRCT